MPNNFASVFGEILHTRMCYIHILHTYMYTSIILKLRAHINRNLLFLSDQTRRPNIPKPFNKYANNAL